MRIHRIEVEGFGPFREREVIDLDRYVDDGLFLIAGRTGAGKSSILDAVSFAVFGVVPRYESAEKRLRSDHCEPGDPTSVSVEFTTGDRRWRIERSPAYERPAKRGGGMTTEQAAVRMGEVSGNGDVDWEAAREREVAHLVAEVVGLNQQQFLQVILLAQGRFAQFLLAGNNDRQSLLRTLFGSRRFEDYERRFEARRAEAESKVAEGEHALAASLDQADGVVAQLAAALAQMPGAREPDVRAADGSGGAREDGIREPGEGGLPEPGDTAGTGDGRVDDAGERGGASLDGSDGARAGEALFEIADDGQGPDAASESGAIGRNAAGGGKARLEPGQSDGAEDQGAGTHEGDETGAAGDGASGAPDLGREAGGAADVPPASHWRVRIGALEEAHGAAGAALAHAVAAEAAAGKHRDEAAAEHERRRGVLEHQRRRDALRDRVAKLEAAAEGIEAARTELAAARRAESVRGALDAAARAEKAAQAAKDAVSGAAIAWQEVRSAATASTDADAGIETLTAFAEAAQQRIGSWEPLRLTEERLPKDLAAVERLHAQATQAGEALSGIAEALAALPGRRRALDEEARAAAELAGQGTLAGERLTTLRARLAAAKEVDRLTARYEKAVVGAEAARTRRDAADAVLTALHRRRLEGYAGELAGALVDGEPCAVCGSAQHPSPAVRATDHVTAEAIDEAEEARASASAAEAAAADARRAAERELSDATARAGEQTVSELTHEVAAAEQTVARTVEAARATERIAAQQRTLAEEETRLLAERTRLDAAGTELTARIRSAEDALARDREAIAEAADGFGSVGDRIAVERRLVETATALAHAVGAESRVGQASGDAAAALDEAVAEAGFAEADSAREAIRATAVQDALDRRVREHDADLRAAQAALDELAELALPEEAADTAASRAALEAAVAERDEASARVASLRHIAGALGALLVTAEEKHALIAELVAEAERIRSLADAVTGRNMRKMDLETFVLAAELEDIVAAANRRLDEMSAGRYVLAHTDAIAYRNAASGLGLEVVDRFTGRSRSPRSLSGGETFLASLSLALGLAEVVTNRAGGITLDTLFIDEGFGSLDAETLEVAMRTLDGLRAGGRTVGVISHVEAMKEQIPAQLRVDRTPQGWSTVVQ